MGPDARGPFMRERCGPQRAAAQKVVGAHLRAAEHATAMATEGETRILTPQTAATPTSSTERTRRPGVMTVLAVGVVAALVVAVVSLFGGRSGRSGSAVAAAGSEVPSPPALVCGSSFKACEGQCVSVDRPDRGCGADACHACNVQNATARCNQLHRCDIAVCYQDFDDCDGDSSNGCETNVRIDPDHCGGCGRKCPALPHAQRGCGDACTIW